MCIIAQPDDDQTISHQVLILIINNKRVNTMRMRFLRPLVKNRKSRFAQPKPMLFVVRAKLSVVIV